MLRYITITDIKIYDSHEKTYNIGDLLNMPFIVNNSPNNPHLNSDVLGSMNNVGKYYNNSILSFYVNSRQDNNEPVPNIERIIHSVNLYTKQNAESYKDIFELVKNPKTLCVHVRNNDLHTEESYINCIINMSKEFDTVILLSGIHSANGEYDFKDHHRFVNFTNTFNTILSKNNNIYIYINNADVHLSLMMNSCNLLVHKGGFSCLGSIVQTGNLFITNLFNCYVTSENWRQYINKPYTIITPNVCDSINNGSKVGIRSSIFDWQFYLNKYPDLSINGVHTEEQAFQHWINCGKKEGRECSVFDWIYYLDKYPDLRQNGIYTEQQAFQHWINCGRKEGRTFCN